MIDVKDEILSGEPKYRFIDANGKIVMDNLTIEQITPVIQSGTPLNKGFFDNVGTVYDSVGRYNTPVSISKAPKHTNDLFAGEYTTTDNVTWTKGGITFKVEGVGGPGSYDSTNYSITNFNGAFDGDDSTYMGNYRDQRGWVPMKITFPYPVRLTKLRIKGYVDKAVSDALTFKGVDLNDGTQVTLYQRSSGEFDTIISCDDYYQTYYLRNYHYSSGTDKFYAIEILEYETMYNQVMYFDNMIKEYKTNQRFLVSTNEELLANAMPQYININDLGEKLVTPSLVPNKKYELVFDGTVFNATEVTA